MRLADPAERVAARADVDAPELELEQRVHPQVLARAPVLQHDARAVQAGRGERHEVLGDHVRRCGGGWRGWVGADVHARRCARAPLCDAQEPRGGVDAVHLLAQRRQAARGGRVDDARGRGTCWVENEGSDPNTNTGSQPNIKSYPNIDIPRISNLSGI